jgi:hypothetical protein
LAYIRSVSHAPPANSTGHFLARRTGRVEAEAKKLELLKMMRHQQRVARRAAVNPEASVTDATDGPLTACLRVQPWVSLAWLES